MKKILIVVLFLILSLKGLAADLAINTATTINVGPFVKIADGTLHTGATVTGISIRIMKMSATLSNSSVQWNATASGGGTHDCIEIADGFYNCELTATDTNTEGKLDIIATLSGDFPAFDRYAVIQQSSYDVNIGGDIASLADLESALAGIPDLVWDSQLETDFTAKALMRLISSSLLGKLSGVNVNAPVFRDVNDSKNRITMTTGATGRSAVTLDSSD